MATAFGILVTIVIVGFLWFYIARPILEDFGVIAVKEYVAIPGESAPEPEPQGSPDFPLLNGDEPRSPGSLNPGDLLLNAAEITAISRMIEHNKTAAKPSKSSSIQAGFGISRGGSSAYQRASAIYDLLFGPPEPAVKYRPLTPEQTAMREGLGLEKR